MRFVGVSWRKQQRKWQAGISHDGKRQYLGYFNDEQEAARVRPTIVEWARTGRGALVGVWCVGEPVCPSVRREPV
jgi:hypothetical protein